MYHRTPLDLFDSPDSAYDEVIAEYLGKGRNNQFTEYPVDLDIIPVIHRIKEVDQHLVG